MTWNRRLALWLLAARVWAAAPSAEIKVDQAATLRQASRWLGLCSSARLLRFTGRVKHYTEPSTIQETGAGIMQGPIYEKLQVSEHDSLITRAESVIRLFRGFPTRYEAGHRIYEAGSRAEGRADNFRGVQDG